MATYESVKYSFVGNAITALQSPNIADGSVTNTEFQHLDGTTSDIQTQLNLKFGSAGGTFTGNVTLNDNVHLFIGSGGATDLDIYHDSSNSYIKNSTGNLNVNADSILFRDDGNTLNMFNAISTGAFNAYHNNSLRFSTTSGGASVAGTLTATALSGNLDASNLTSGTVPNTRIQGANLTGLNATAIDSGTLANARLPSSISVSNVAGTLSGNGSSITNLNASNISSGTIPSARVSGIARAVTSTTVLNVVPPPVTSTSGTAPTFAGGTSQSGASVTIDVTNIDKVVFTYGMESWIAGSPTDQNYCTSFTGAQIRLLRSGSGSSYLPSQAGMHLNDEFFSAIATIPKLFQRKNQIYLQLIFSGLYHFGCKN